MNQEELLAEVEDLLRNMPDRSKISHDTDENFSWLGNVAAVIEAWDPPRSITLSICLDKIRSGLGKNVDEGLGKILTLMHQARHDLRMKTFGPMSIAVQKGMVFDYFDEIRKIIQTASQDLYFVDPYLDAEFVSKYLGNAAQGVKIRLLTREKLKTLLPAVDAYMQQHQSTIEVRSCSDFHDRYLFVDRSSCFQSGASFKDGAKTSPTTLTQISDAFSAIFDTYDKLWSNASVVRPSMPGPAGD